MRRAGGRCHCPDRGDTGRHTAAQGRPAEDNGVWKLAGAGAGKVSDARPPLPLSDTMNAMFSIVHASPHCWKFWVQAGHLPGKPGDIREIKDI